MRTLALLASGWLFTGWLGWRVGIYFWVRTFDMTRGDRRALRWLLVFGPINLAVALGLLVEDVRKNPHPNMDDVLYPRKELT